jgi:hypothetical protein
MSEDNLRLLEIAPRPGAQGYYMPGESEYRVHSGAVLPVRRLLKFDESKARGTKSSWLGVVKDWDESKHPRGKTSPESTPGSFAPAATQIPDDIAQVLRGWTQNDQQWEWSNLQHAAQFVLSGQGPDKYVLYDYRGDDRALYATAKRTMNYLNSAPSPGRPLYRGLHGEYLPGHGKGKPAYLDNPVREFKVGDEFSESLTSWTGKQALAQKFANDAYSDKEFRSPRKGTVLVLDPEGARAAPVSQLADVGRKILREADEWMASGRYRVHEITEGRDGTRFVHVRRVGAASHANIAKDWDESKHPRGKTTPESTPGSFAPAQGELSDTARGRVRLNAENQAKARQRLAQVASLMDVKPEVLDKAKAHLKNVMAEAAIVINRRTPESIEDLFTGSGRMRTQFEVSSSSGLYSRRITNQPLPGVVWIQLPRLTPSGCRGPKYTVVTPAASASAAGDGKPWLPARGWRCGVSSIERVWLS